MCARAKELCANSAWERKYARFSCAITDENYSWYFIRMKTTIAERFYMESRFDHFSFSCVEEFMYVQQFIVVCCLAWNTNILWIMVWITHPFSYTPSHYLVQTNFHCKTKFRNITHRCSISLNWHQMGTLGVNTEGMEVLFEKKKNILIFYKIIIL